MAAGAPPRPSARRRRALVESVRRGGDAVLRIAGIDGDLEEGESGERRAAALEHPGGAAVVTAHGADAAVRRQRIRDAAVEDRIDVSLAGADIHAVRIGGVDGDGTAAQTRAGEVGGILIEVVHRGAPATASVVRPPYAAVGRGDVHARAAGRDGDSRNASADRGAVVGLRVLDDGGSDWRPVVLPRNRGHRARPGGEPGDESSPAARRFRTTLVVLLELVLPVVFREVGERRRTKPQTELADVCTFDRASAARRHRARLWRSANVRAIVGPLGLEPRVDLFHHRHDPLFRPSVRPLARFRVRSLGGRLGGCLSC